MSATLVAKGPQPAREPARRGYIPEIEGIRGIALTLVVLFHVFGNGRISGGVDVFLFISGYLLTRTLVSRAERPEPFLRAHYTRTLSRLVPAALTVLIAVAIATIAWAPATRWIQTGHEIVASALYFENWELIASQLSYGAAGPETSPLQHFWSLSVQGQFLLFWPLLILTIVAFSSRARWPISRSVTVVAALITAVSFAYALLLVSVDQPVAYFNTFARAWELTAGALVAMLHPAIRLGAAARIVLSWIGLALILSCGFVIDGAQEFPGPATLWPIAGVVLMILGSGTDGRATTHRWLGTRPVLFFATIAYALYLWHWPVLVFYLQLQGHSSVGPAGAAVVFAVSVALAWLTQRFVVAPLLRSRSSAQSGRRLVTLAACLGVVALVAGLGTARLESTRDAALALSGSSSQHPGALVMTGLSTDDGTWDEPAAPAAEYAYHDMPDPIDLGCTQAAAQGPEFDAVRECPPYGPADATKTIILSGGSKVIQWYPAWQELADQEGWRLIVIDKGKCRLADPSTPGAELTRSCAAWNDAAFDVIAGHDPDAVFTIATETAVSGGAEVYSPAQGARWRELSDAGIPVLAMRDTPRFPGSVPDCLLAHSTEPDACAQHPEATFADESPAAREYTGGGDVALLDLTSSFCTEDACEPIIGNVTVYRDWHHMTATYARTMAPALRESLVAAAPSLFAD